MAFDDLKDKLVDSFTQTKEKFAENPHVQTIKEKFETLPAQTQKIILTALGVLGVLILLYLPYSFLSSSADNVADFNKHRNLIRSLFKYSQLPKGKTPLPATSNANNVTSQIRSSLGRFDLLPNQIISIEETDLKSTGKSLVKKPIQQTAIKASFKQLNVRQVVDLSFHLKNFKDHIKLISTSMSEDTDKKQYYNVDYRLVSYAFPVKKVPLDKGKKKKKKKSKKKKKKKTKK